MRAAATFTVSDWTPLDLPRAVGGVGIPETAAPAGVAAMVKTFAGDFAGRSVTWFVGGLNTTSGAGTYVAVESFEGTLGGRPGTFGFVHAASTHGSDRYDEYFTVVPDSGTGALAGITGQGSLAIDEDGTHRVELEYLLPQ
ncbi:DUF3224 domain-containing protein [Nocardioides sp. QY071]|uniref:DUF3224 domain-containing protein n=1 Tax=Nocardioides sp. QY071 TaxID=3044187 RepID=UPI00249B0E1E|nr:DUF3224 domain-containing protein [Nocardioides sp. QY071]WGY04670.1 DUF3224 domain-containing protein [Nocardioides sp. QY071]